MNIINKVATYADRGQRGGWNDLDMLEVGLGGMSDEEYKVICTHCPDSGISTNRCLLGTLFHVGSHQIPTPHRRRPP